jgi:3-dehydroquinate dehydratase I
MNPKICLSIGHTGFNQVVELLKGVALAEIRMDLLELNDEQLKSVFNLHKNLIATYRANKRDFMKMVSTLNLAIENGCTYIDIDIESPESYRNKLIEKAKESGCKVILSYHNFSETPDTKQLNQIVSNLFKMGADIAKVACMANFEEDCRRVIELYSKYKNIVAFSMGEIGKNTRIEALKMGAPFTFASVKGKETAPGQMSYEEIESQLDL